MQASLTSFPGVSPFAPLRSTTSFLPKLSAGSTSTRFASIRTYAQAVDYNSTISVFPAEACETIGGDTCHAGIYPELKLKPEAREPKIALEPVDREYLDYADPTTVLLDEACDVLGGEFCETP